MSRPLVPRPLLSHVTYRNLIKVNQDSRIRQTFHLCSIFAPLCAPLWVTDLFHVTWLNCYQQFDWTKSDLYHILTYLCLNLWLTLCLTFWLCLMCLILSHMLYEIRTIISFFHSKLDFSFKFMNLFDNSFVYFLISMQDFSLVQNGSNFDFKWGQGSSWGL